MGKCFIIKTYRIYLIRHGATQGNLDGKYIGITDDPLCLEGIEELEQLRREYEYPRAQKVYASRSGAAFRLRKCCFPTP